MLGDDDDVFDSVTWESPAAPAYDIEENFAARGPGFRQSTADSEEGRGPHDPKWEGYLITSVKDPVKELAETKDAYVSYLVSAKVSALGISALTSTHIYSGRQTFRYSLPNILHHVDASKISSFCAII